MMPRVVKPLLHGALVAAALAAAQAQAQQHCLDAYFLATSCEEASYTAQVIGNDSGQVRVRVLDHNGGLVAIGHYASDSMLVPDGHFTFYYADGSVESAGNYVDGNKDGVWLRYSAQGLALAEKVYDSSVLADLVFTQSQVAPSFPGGQRAMTRFVHDKVGKVPGRMMAQFIVEKDGSLTDVKVLGADDADVSDRIVAAIGSSPRWQAGLQNGRPVRVRMHVPLK